MTHDQRKQVYRKAIDQYGEALQLTVAIEEMAECQKELCKFIRGNGNTDNLAEEVADVLIMMEQVMYIFGIDDAVNRETNRKVERLENRITKHKRECTQHLAPDFLCELEEEYA